MFIKCQQFDATNSCFPTLNPTKNVPSIQIGVSFTPIQTAKYDHKRGQLHKLQHQEDKLLQGTKWVKNPSRKDVLFENPVGKVGKDENFGGNLAQGNDMKNSRSNNTGSGIPASGCRIQNNFLRNKACEIDKDVNLNGKSRPKGGQAVLEKSHPGNSTYKRRENGGLNGGNAFSRSPGWKMKDKRRIGDDHRGVNFNGGGVEQVKTKCSTKWLKYSGCIPAILEALESFSDLDEAFRPWEKSLTNKERSIILKEQEGWERALEIFEWFRRKGCYEVNVIHYNIMLRILGKAKRWAEVEYVLEEMRRENIKPINSTYGTLIDVYSKGDRRKDAVSCLELMNAQGMEPDEVTLGTIVQMYKKAGEFKKAEEFFKMWSSENSLDNGKGNLGRNAASSRSDSGAPVCLSSITYNTMIDTYGKAGQVEEACQTFDQMLREGIVPTTVTFNTMIHVCGNNGQLDEVSSLMKKMNDLRCAPDIRTYNILIALHAKHDDITTAANYFRKMKAASLEPDIVSYRTLVYAFSIRHMVNEVEELISEMDERGLEIDEFTQSALTRMYIEAGMLEKSWLWFQRFHLSGNMTSECYSANIDAFGEHGYVLEAEKVFNCCVEEKKLSVVDFNVMIKAYGISKRYGEACCLFDDMEEHGILPDRCSYNSLIQMLASANMPEKANSYVMKMHEAGFIDDCVPYGAVISSFVRSGKLTMAARLYKEMLSFKVQPDVILYGILINAFADSGNVAETTAYFDEMVNSGIPPNEVIYSSLIKLYTKVGYLKEAQETYRRLQSFESGADVYSSNCMIDLYSERSMTRQAEEVFEYLKRNRKANEFSYAMMLCMYRKNGRFSEATQIAQKMKELGLLTELLTFNNVLGLYASDGRYKEATETFKEMLASSIEPDDSTFKALSNILAKCGVPREAIFKLERKRKKDAKLGLQAWSSILSSLIAVSHDDYDDGDYFQA
ncbi:OLC1v1019887C1 [Oldenlandia corymbosa var. corymbosa]|uniref:OLC1v1019887C1 n=1 Tax=Oldenlandia corymbosa var. corymbosa TaxID=529605 RepID=A0AAV1EFH6_OLDCO|nr:OLC1v1019887C1 [Oldenlandia corymbosa var. corymbosa]